MFRFKNILKEVGEGSSNIYEYSRVRFGEVEGEYNFETENGWEYWVTFELTDPLNFPGAAIKVDFGVHGEENNFETEEGKTIKVINTIIKILKDHVDNINFEKYSGIDYIIFVGASKGGGSDIKSKRSKIYHYFTKKQFPSYDISQKDFKFGLDGPQSGKYLTMKIK